MRVAEIRQAFVDFFKNNDHTLYPSSPVIPFDDPTLMFANAGMNQFKDIFTGRKKPDYPRAVSVQKCMRAGGKHNDLENVGRTGRHHTFFEMLGNFSFGDYFKEQAILYAWEWITEVIGLPKDKLYATVYLDDDEAFDLWGKIAPELKNGRILRFDKKENYWAMGETGPNGPCSELHFDRGEKYGTGPDDVVNGETERFVEIWNLVFMQYNTKPDGSVEPLPKPSVDTGAGLERIACVLQEAESDYETDAFTGLIEAIADLTGRKYHTDDRGVSHRVVADHIRALTFSIADGGGISNEKQGYVLRRILRRAARHGRKLGTKEPFLYKMVPTLVDQMGDFYPEIKEKGEHIQKVVQAEEESFGRTLDTGLELFDELVKKIKDTDGKFIPGGEVFRLYDTYGFPVDLTQVMAEEVGLAIDMEGFERMMGKQKSQSRAAGQFSGTPSNQLQTVIREILSQAPDDAYHTEFTRDSFELQAEVQEIFELSDGQSELIAIIPSRTPFYVEAGGQTGDTGTIESDHFRLRIESLIKHNDAVVHIGTLVEKRYENLEDVKIERVKIRVDESRRMDIMRNHTATHLLHASLKKVLGDHANQSGSYVGPDKLRFDFSHFQAMTPAEIGEVERLVNEKILAGFPVSTVEDNLENAKKSGATAIFGEKYSDRVRVVSIEDYSKELCGGTHVDNVSQIGPFMITLETAVASGIRRIEAVTGSEAIRRMLQYNRTIGELERMSHHPAEQLIDIYNESAQKIQELQKENKKLKATRFAGGADSIGEEIKSGKLTIRFHDFGEVAHEEMAGWIDAGKEADEALISIAIGNINGKKTFMSSAGSKADIHVGRLTAEVLKDIGGRGGGKPNFAQGSVPPEVSIRQVAELFAKSVGAS